MNNAKDKGHLSENFAGHFLQSRGYVVWKTNIHSRFGELDLILVKESQIYLCEVKSVNESCYINTENLHSRKFKRMYQTFYIRFSYMKSAPLIMYVLIVWSNDNKYVINQENYLISYEDWY